MQVSGAGLIKKCFYLRMKANGEKQFDEKPLLEIFFRR